MPRSLPAGKPLRVAVVGGMLVLATVLSQVNIPFDLLTDEFPDCANANPRLPNVLLIGDSTQIRYFPFVVIALRGSANVCRVVEWAPQRIHSLFYGGPLLQPVNAGSSESATLKLDKWIGNKRWDVIHFNWGLHDLDSVLANAASSDTDEGIETYRSNLERTMDFLLSTDSQLVFALTTPVANYRKTFDGRDGVELMNEVAIELASSRGILINDLHTVALPRLSEIQIANDVHFNDAGSRILGNAVAASILQALQTKQRVMQ